jgi:hypothetical protein
LSEIQREHVVNRALMRQELAFLEHLVRLVGAEEQGGRAYSPPGESPEQPARRVHHVLDMQA